MLGGSACGKSGWAEDLACRLGGTLIYLATMEPWGQEGAARIARHRQARTGKGFHTLEQPRHLESCSIPPHATVLLEDLGNLVANETFSGKNIEKAAALANLERGLTALEEKAEHLVVVGNDLFRDGEDYPPETMAYLEVLAQIQTALSKRYDLVAELVCGIPVFWKGEEI